MANLSKRLEQIVSKELTKNLIPVKTEKGILVGDILIINNNSVKDLWRNNHLIYENIFLNSTAITIANNLAKKINIIKNDELYRADQEYGKWFIDSQLLRNKYQRSVSAQDYDRADILWARYSESRDRAVAAKNYAQSLTRI